MLKPTVLKREADSVTTSEKENLKRLKIRIEQALISTSYRYVAIKFRPTNISLTSDVVKSVGKSMHWHI